MRPTAPLLGRLRKLHLTTKNVNQGWHYADYNKVGLLGDWDPKTKRFQPDWSKVRTYVLPQDSYWKGHEYQMKWDGPEVSFQHFPDGLRLGLGRPSEGRLFLRISGNKKGAMPCRCDGCDPSRIDSG
jgi:hypothetical protein